MPGRQDTQAPSQGRGDSGGRVDGRGQRRRRGGQVDRPQHLAVRRSGVDVAEHLGDRGPEPGVLGRGGGRRGRQPATGCQFLRHESPRGRGGEDLLRGERAVAGGESPLKSSPGEPPARSACWTSVRNCLRACRWAGKAAAGQIASITSSRISITDHS